MEKLNKQSKAYECTGPQACTLWMFADGPAGFESEPVRDCLVLEIVEQNIPRNSGRGYRSMQLDSTGLAH